MGSFFNDDLIKLFFGLYTTSTKVRSINMIEPNIMKIAESEHPIVEAAVRLAYATIRYDPYDPRGNYMMGSLICYILRDGNTKNPEFRVKAAKVAKDLLKLSMKPKMAVLGAPDDMRIPEYMRELFEIIDEVNS